MLSIKSWTGNSNLNTIFRVTSYRMEEGSYPEKLMLKKHCENVISTLKETSWHVGGKNRIYSISLTAKKKTVYNRIKRDFDSFQLVLGQNSIMLWSRGISLERSLKLKQTSSLIRCQNLTRVTPCLILTSLQTSVHMV